MPRAREKFQKIRTSESLYEAASNRIGCWSPRMAFPQILFSNQGTEPAVLKSIIIMQGSVIWYAQWFATRNQCKDIDKEFKFPGTSCFEIRIHVPWVQSSSGTDPKQPYRLIFEFENKKFVEIASFFLVKRPSSLDHKTGLADVMEAMKFEKE